MKTLCCGLAIVGMLSLVHHLSAQTPPAESVPPPSAPPQKSAADLEKLLAPIALYPDPLLATVLPASAYPLEIVQAARFVKDTNNLAKLDEQPWDTNVKAVARIPEVINKLNDDIAWTSDLGQAFVEQQKEVMEAVQALRGKAQTAGALQTTPQQVVVVTNSIVEKTIEQQVVVVTNTVVQIQPSQPEVVYVPQYNPATVYYPPPYPPATPLISFGVGLAVGAVIANNCDWHGGGIWVGGGHGDVDIDIERNVNVNQNFNRNVNANANANRASGQKWQPDSSRLQKSGAPGVSSSAQSRENRGYSGASPSAASTANRPGGTAGASQNRAAATPSAGGNRPSSTPSAANRPAATPSAANRPAASAAPSAASRPSPSGAGGQAQSRPAAQSSSSAFSGAGGGAQTQASSSRGAASRGGGGMSGGSRGGGGGGGRGGGGRR